MASHAIFLQISCKIPVWKEKYQVWKGYRLELLKALAREIWGLKKKNTTNRKSRNQCNYIDLGEGEPRVEENLVRCDVSRTVVNRDEKGILGVWEVWWFLDLLIIRPGSRLIRVKSQSIIVINITFLSQSFCF